MFEETIYDDIVVALEKGVNRLVQLGVKLRRNVLDLFSVLNNLAKGWAIGSPIHPVERVFVSKDLSYLRGGVWKREQRESVYLVEAELCGSVVRILADAGSDAGYIVFTTEGGFSNGKELFRPEKRVEKSSGMGIYGSVYLNYTRFKKVEAPMESRVAALSVWPSRDESAGKFYARFELDGAEPVELVFELRRIDPGKQPKQNYVGFIYPPSCL